ncbi:MAG: outer membrane protein [Panacagrimonas sp.]
MARKILLPLVAIVVALLAALPAAAQSRRAGTGEIYFGPVFTDGKSYSFEGGTTARTDTGIGLSIGYAFNFDRHVSAGVDFVWGEQDYRATVQPGPGNLNREGNINGTLETWTVRFNGSYHFLTGNFTPYVTGGLGWSTVDTNIPSGLPDTFCWYYPWWGQYCGTYVPTHDTTKFSYNLGAGLRLDVGKGVFRALIDHRWVDFGGSYGSSGLIHYRIDFGVKF